MRKFMVTLALLVSMTTASVSAAGLGVCTHMGLGNSYDNLTNIKATGEVNVGWLRDEARWATMQTTVNGEFKIRDKDLDYIKRADAAGINQLLVLSYGNPAYGVAADNVMPTQDNSAYYNGFLDYVRYTVNQVKDYVEAYEIWNEPNVQSFNYNLEATGEDYAKLYLDAQAIIAQLDPTAKVVCGAITGSDSPATAFGKEILGYIRSNSDINRVIDAFSIHIYPGINDEGYAKYVRTWEDVLDSYGFTGEVWMTENGLTADGNDNRTETAQAIILPKLAVQWERYLKESGRNGMNFWYDLRNEVGISQAEDNFGLFDSTYKMKPSGHAMKAYNTLTKDMTLESVDRIKTKDYIVWDDQYGYVAKYKNDIETTYILYDSNNNNKTATIDVVGDIAYVYDYKGNVKTTYINPSSQKQITMSSEPVYVRSITYNTTIDSSEYDENEGILTVTGKTNISDKLTIELLKGEEIVGSQTAIVNAGEYKGWFSVMEGGTYTVRVGKAQAEEIGRPEKTAQKEVSVKGLALPEYATSTMISYNAETRSVAISGKVNNFVENQYVTVLALPASMDVSNVDINAAAYIRQIPTTNGEFTANFKLPDYYGTKMAVYLGGTDINTKLTQNADVEENKYVYVASFEIGKTSTLTATANVRNFAEVAKEASIIVAQYSDDKCLKNMVIEEKVIPAKTYGTIECTISNVSIEGNASYAKAFIWNDMDELVPLAEFESISLK